MTIITDFYLLNYNELELFTMTKFVHYTLFYQGKNGHKLRGNINNYF
jgi:hypothetical protein